MEGGAAANEWWFDQSESHDAESSESGEMSWVDWMDQSGAETGSPRQIAVPGVSVRRATEPASAGPRPKKHRQHYRHNALSADQVEQLLVQNLPTRPLILDIVTTPQAEVGGWLFKETGKGARPPNKSADKWRRGGGAGDATDLPSATEPRVRRRYGYLVPQGGLRPRLRYHQYCRLIPANADTGVADGNSSLGVAEDTSTWLFHVLPDASQQSPASSPAASQSRADQKPIARGPQTAAMAIANAHSRTTQVVGTLHVDARAEHPDHGQALLHLTSSTRQPGKTTNFVRFEEAGAEVGGIYHSDRGVQFRSGAGDFAEWHSALDPSELPFAEGSVVGLFGGKISLSTANADMVAVVSRRALCVGSFPGNDRAAEGDIIAYLGQVPVRVRGHVANGDPLVPSMEADGFAVSSKAMGSSTNQQLHLPVIGIAMSWLVPMDSSQREGMVNVLITPPSAQNQHIQPQPQQPQQPQHQHGIDPVLDFANYRQHSATKKRFLRHQCRVAVLIGVALSVALVCAINSTTPTVHSTSLAGVPNSETPDHAIGPRNNCSAWLEGCGQNGNCFASTCECAQGWGGEYCEDLLCDLAVSSPACAGSRTSTCLPLGESAGREHGVCWPEFYQMGATKATNRTSFVSRDQALNDLMYAPHGQFLGTYERLDGLHCGNMPIYKLDEAWNCTQRSSTGQGCVFGKSIPAFLFYRQANISGGGFWAVGLGSGDSGYSAPDCESNLLAFTNNMWAATCTECQHAHYNWNADGDNGYTLGAAPCQSNPAATGCRTAWQECIRDIVHPRADGLIGCSDPSTIDDDGATWRIIASIAVLAR